MPFASVPDAIQEIRCGHIVVVVDDEDRENEGDLTVAAEKITPEIINFMAIHGRGLICLPLTAERCDYLRLPLMSPTNTSTFGTAPRPPRRPRAAPRRRRRAAAHRRPAQCPSARTCRLIQCLYKMHSDFV